MGEQSKVHDLDDLIEKAARIAGLIDWNPTCLPRQHELTIVRQILEVAASLGLLADPDQHAELKQLQARIDAALGELDASCPPPRLSRIRDALQGARSEESR